MTTYSEYLYKKASVNKIPLNGCFELSPVCNFACKMCYVRKTPEQVRKEGKKIKEWTEWLKLAKDCKEAGMLYLLLTGGEPFIYPGFKKLYFELKKMGFLISINTNGTMITEDTIAWLKESAPYRINITLYGTSEDTYEKICGDRTGFERAKKAIIMLKEAGIQVVINASMIPENAEDMETMIAFGKKYNIPIRISTYMFPPVRREREKEDSRFTSRESAKMFLKKQEYLIEQEVLRKRLETEIQKIYKNEIETTDKIWGENLEYMRCRAGRCSFWVSWDGKMTACGMLDFPIVTDPFLQSFYECWLKLTDTVRSTKVMYECNRCEKKEICKPCVAMLYAETGNVNEKAAYLCEMTDYIIEEIKEKLLEMQ